MSVLLDKDALNTRIDPKQFDVSINAILIGVGAEKYVDIFKKHNISQCTLAELTDEDLIRLGVDDADIRSKLLVEAKNLPIYEETKNIRCSHLSPMELAGMLDESGSHLYKIYLSMMANTLALKKTKNLTDCLVHKDLYASNIAICTLNEINKILTSMDTTIQSQLMVLGKEPKNKNKKKILVGTIGSAVIAVLTVLFVRSLKQLK